VRSLIFVLGLVSLLAFAIAASMALGQAPSAAPPERGASATAFACSKETLLKEQHCAVEGTTVAQPISREQAKENQRTARAFAEDVCGALARSHDADEGTGLLAACNARGLVATKRCGGDGSRPLLDAAGLVNPGHGRCYGALVAMVADVSALADLSLTCCACIADRCGGSANQCVGTIDAGRAPPACASSTCSGACAALQLMAPRKR
jgi:hypothetical protein